MELCTPEPHETLPKFELNGVRKGLFVKLKDESGSFLWAMVRGRQADVFFGLVESAYEGGPCRGTRISFTKANVYEIV